MVLSYSPNVHLIFLICFTIQYCVMTFMMFVIDAYKRWKMERDKPLWVDAKYFPSWTHFRFTMIYVSCTVIIFSIMLIPRDIDPNVQNIVIAFSWTVLFLSDWIVTVASAAVFLMIKYQKKANPIGQIIAVIGTTLLFVNILAQMLSQFASFDYSYNLYTALQFVIYLVISIALEAIYFNISFIFVFRKDSSVCAGIYGFLDGFVRPLFRSVYCIIKYLIVIILFIAIMADYLDSVYNTAFYQYGAPFLLQIWFVACFFTMRRNRPHPPQCVEIKLWRPFIEIFWRYAVSGYNERNTVPLRRNIEWADLKTLERNRKRLELIHNKQKNRSPKTRNSSINSSKRSSIKKIQKVQDEEIQDGD